MAKHKGIKLRDLKHPLPLLVFNLRRYLFSFFLMSRELEIFMFVVSKRGNIKYPFIRFTILGDVPN